MATVSKELTANTLDILAASRHSLLFTSLLHGTKVAPYKSYVGPMQRQSFGSTDDHFLQLSREVSPFYKSKALSLQELQDMCLVELDSVRDYFGKRRVYWAPRGCVYDIDGAAEQDPSVQLIRSLTDPDIVGTGEVVSFPSETLDQLCIEAEVAAPKGLLQTSQMKCTVLAKDVLMPLQHNNEGTTIITVLSGSMTWIIWPPTAHNLNILQTSYEAFAINYDNEAPDVSQDLEGGTVLTQSEGEGLRIPPFSPMIGLSLNKTVLATHSTVTADNFIAMLQNAPLLQAWFTTELDGAHKQSEFNARLLKCLDALLNGVVDPDPSQQDTAESQLSFTTSDTTLRHLLAAWDGIKDPLAALLGPADAKVLVAIWTDFLIYSRGRKCQLCGTTIRNKMRLMRGHFRERHWPVKMAKKRVDSRADAEGEGEGEGEGGLGAGGMEGALVHGYDDSDDNFAGVECAGVEMEVD